MGFAEYLLDTRLAHVKRGLKEREATVKELSEQAGFPDYQHFCKTFKKKVGLSRALPPVVGKQKLKS